MSKAEATARMYFLGGRPVEPLGPGSKEKKSALDALGRFVGIDLRDTPGKIECGRRIADQLQAPWDSMCYSVGETITLVGMNRLLDAAVRQLPPDDETLRLVRRLSTLPPAPKAGLPERTQMSEDSDLEQNIAERIATLSEVGDTPVGVAPILERLEPSDVRFDDGGVWRARVALVQSWLHLPEELDQSSPDSFDRSLARSLGLETAEAGTAVHSDDLFPRLAERLERAVSLREKFLEEMEATAEGAATRESATQRWANAWDEVVEDEETEVGGPIHAYADTWPISEFAQYAVDGELNLSPSYQRADVWPTGDAQMLIESVLRGVPLPSVIILKQQDAGTVNYEVVDGKQRLTSILRFTGRHPRALEVVAEKARDWNEPELLEVFHSDYPKFKKLWKKYETQSLTAQVERLNYFPFALRSGDVKPLSGDLSRLRGRYYSQIRNESIDVVGEQRQLRTVFEQTSKYRLPVIVYEQVTTEQIHEVFSLYNRQGKHLNAEEIRNALYHRLAFMRAVLVTAGDSDDIEAVAPFLAPHWYDLSSTRIVLDSYGFGKAGYKRTKLLSWVASVLYFDDGRPDGRSTASQINALLKRVAADPKDPLRSEGVITEAMLLLDRGLDAHAAIPMEVWAPSFKNSQGQSKWQELQLVATLIAFSAARQVLGDRLDDVVDRALPQIGEASAQWKRPQKTQSKEQWDFIARVVGELLELLGVAPSDVDMRLRDRFGHSGLGGLISITET
ncbi:DUF262 domain-containing protein [Cellulomonas sp. Root485]|uniref:DUF262 domain-containing protein n=1 Tax=Cellulomonas sp. Root485 TaxID=1736546 RepID=UPI0009E76861|nr:DUF262 domain-containing protein [Cellulomonas sp. Root485]